MNVRPRQAIRRSAEWIEAAQNLPSQKSHPENAILAKPRC
jgi:hypothetical protein